MNIKSFNEELQFDEQRIMTKVLLETTFSKEIRILLKEGQHMKEHKAPFPILIHILQGRIDLGVEGKIVAMHEGDIIALAGGIPHNLSAKENTIVRLTLSKQDQVTRVENVIKS